MKTYAIINERYSIWTAEVTIDDLELLAKQNDWDVSFTETFRMVGDEAVNVVVDDQNEIVAVQPDYEIFAVERRREARDF